MKKEILNGRLINWLMFADATVLLGDSEEKLERQEEEFGRVCRRRKLTVNETKSKTHENMKEWRREWGEYQFE